MCLNKVISLSLSLSLYGLLHNTANILKFSIETFNKVRSFFRKFSWLLAFTLHIVVVVDPLLPDYWGESASVVLWGFVPSFSRQSSSRAATPEGSLHKSRADSMVGICGQLKRCCVVCS